MDRLVYLGENKQLHVYSSELLQSQQLTYALEAAMSPPSVWPVWSPDGKWIAYFQPPSSNSKARVCVAEVDGIDVRVLSEHTERVPIYIKWSPDSQYLAVIEQHDGLSLVAYPINGDKAIPLDEGAPIFFEWVPDSSGLIAHLLDPLTRRSRVQFYSILDSELDFIVSQTSGGFCSPVFLGGQLIYAEQTEARTNVVLCNIRSNERTRLCSFNGVLALLPRPRSVQFAVAVTSKGDGSPYNGVQLYDLENGQLSCLVEDSVQAMFWDPTGERILYSGIDEQKRCYKWRFWEQDRTVEIGAFWPTPAQLFYLHFFEQFSLSHHLLSSDGERFYFSGFGPPKSWRGSTRRPMIFQGCFQEQAEFIPVSTGLFPALLRKET